MKNTLLTFIVFLIGISSVKAQEQIPKKGEMPILAWYSIPDSACSIQRYEELRDAGFTATFPHLNTLAEVDRALAVCKQTNVKLLVKCDELWNKTTETVNYLKKNPYVLAYFLRDEPVCKEFANYGTKVKEIQALDPERSCYINLLPDCGAAALGAPYPEYVERGIKELGIKIVSFDIYPIRYDGILSTWYYQLETVSAAARKANLPFWAFALLTTHGNYPTPTLASLRLQLYSDLAYGAQCLQYFTYWNPIDVTFDYRFAPIAVNGKRSFIYDLVKQMNHEIQQVAGVFLGAKVESVRHLGDHIPSGIMRLTTLPKGFNVIDTHGAHALVSQLQNDGHHYVIIQNCELDNSMMLTISMAPNIKRVFKDGTIASAALYDNTTRLDPGDIEIYTY